MKKKMSPKQERKSKQRRGWLIDPDSSVRTNWDLIISVVLIFTCLVIPVRIAFVEEDDFAWTLINWIIDFLFFMDILINFNTAFYDSNLELVTCRKTIALNYLKTWFIIDFFAVIPFGLIS